jgi:hypothetical protein
MATDPDLLSPLLTQLDGIARAPMTAQERELRAKSVLGDTLEVGDVAGAMAREDLPWNAAKASEHGVPTKLWLRAVETADIPASASVDQLLERMHRADAMAEMIKAGYEALSGWAPLGKG